MVEIVLVPGFPKCGTTTIHNLLLQAGLQSTAVKEPGFALRPGISAGELGKLYAASGPATAARLVDATPWYIYSEAAAHLLDSRCKRAIVAVRDPLQRVVSMHRDQVRTGAERRDLSQAIAEELHGTVIVERKRRYVDSSRYFWHLAKWRANAPNVEIRLIDLSSLEAVVGSGALAEYLGAAGRPMKLGLLNEADGPRGAAPEWFAGLLSGVGRLLPASTTNFLVPRVQSRIGWSTKLPAGVKRRPASSALDKETEEAVRAALRGPQLSIGEPPSGELWLGEMPEWLDDFTNCPSS